MKRFNEEVVTAAILGFEEQKRKINSQIEELRAMLAPPAEGITATPRRKGRVSAAARRAMAEAQRRRWAAVRAAKK